jgi:hypothetical protein
VKTHNRSASLLKFGPGTANTFRKMLDLTEVSWNGIKMCQTEALSISNTKKLLYQIFESGKSISQNNYRLV